MPDLTNIKALILDMDGVLWRSTEAIGDLPEIFDQLNKAKIQVVFATNNATRDEAQYISKLADFGILANEDQIVNSSMATASFLLEKFPKGGPLYVIGESGLLNILKKNGFFHSDSDPLAIVVGMDHNLTYEKMSKAAIFINHGVPFIGTNPDKSFPTPQGETIGTGAILAAIEAATNISPMICGKPFPNMMDLAIQRMGTLRSETLVVGDRYETDVIGGINAHCPTALVLSGVTPRKVVPHLKPAPTFVFEDLTQLVEELLSCNHK